MSSQVRLTVVAALATALATSCLAPLFHTGAWVPATLLAIAVTAASAQVGRHLRLPAVLVALGGLLGLVLTLTYVFARDEAWLWVLPNTEVLARVSALVAAGQESIELYAAPVAVDPGLSFLTTAGVGLVALAVDTVAVTLRRPAASGLALLALYSVPAAVAPDGVGWAPFTLGAGGFLALLLAEAREKVTRWGRPLERPGRVTRDATGPLAALGRRVGVAAIGLAVVVPALVPGIDEAVLGSGGAGLGNGSGDNTVAVVNPILDLSRDLNRAEDREVLRYRTQAETPSYIRLVVLDNFDGSLWAPSRLSVPREQTVDRGLATPVGLAAATPQEEVRTEMELLDLDTRWLPLPYPAQRVEDIDGDWLWDEATFNVFSVESSTRRQDYTVTSLEVTPSRPTLRSAGPPSVDLERFLALPGDVPPEILTTAAQVVGTLGTPYERAVAVQDWLREDGNFRYDEQAPDGSGLAAIAAFLRERQGFCVHFASTMAVLARALDIPARVAVGFTPGEEVEPGTYSVTTHDAHAWPEIYLEGAGWLPFEPTPAVRTGSPPPYAQPEAGPGRDEPATDTPAGATVPTGGAVAPGPSALEGLEDRLGGGTSAVTAERSVPWTAVVAGLVALAALLSPAVARLAVRRRRWSRAASGPGLATAAWAETRDLSVDYGHRVDEPATPRQFAHHVGTGAGLDLPSREALGRLARAAERSQYARSVGDVGDLRADVRAVRRGLAAGASRWQRLRAAALPRSTGALLHTAGERVADGLDWMDASAAAVRQRVRPRPGQRMLPSPRPARDGGPSRAGGRRGASGRGSGRATDGVAEHPAGARTAGRK